MTVGNLLGNSWEKPAVGQPDFSHFPTTPRRGVGNGEKEPREFPTSAGSGKGGKWEKAATVVLETRIRDGLKWRRLRTSTGRTYWTVEVPETVLRAVATQGQVAARLARWQSGELKRERIAEISRMAVEGVKPDAIAAMFPDISRGQVLKHCAAAKAGRGAP